MSIKKLSIYEIHYIRVSKKTIQHHYIRRAVFLQCHKRGCSAFVYCRKQNSDYKKNPEFFERICIGDSLLKNLGWLFSIFYVYIFIVFLLLI